ncbi:hypothetical protein [Elongatibacter sediminis]|uniref:Secreted protein n=1 Tax=Elongatibacter sediminis TaxID=3119006 RepID=A0AAW9RB15_9GAMM
MRRTRKISLPGWPRFVVVLVLLLFAATGAAQEAPEAAWEPPELPDLRELSASLAEPSSRNDTLLTLLAVSRLLGRTSPVDEEAVGEWADQFRDDRGWLDLLAARYVHLPSRSPILDPASWFVQQELGQQNIHPPHDISPLGPGFPALSHQLFDRSDERLAAAFLPETLFQVEVMAPALWQTFRDRVAGDPGFGQVAAALNADWFDPWMAAEPPAPERSGDAGEPLEVGIQRLRELMFSLTLPAPPDALGARRLRFGLYEALPELDPAASRTAAQMLRLASAVEGLHSGRYLEFIQGLLWAVTDLLDTHVHDPAATGGLPPLIAEFLPRLSATLSRQFNDIDPRFNANIAAAFDVAQELADGELPADRMSGLQEELADAVAQLVLMASDLAFYFDQPVRQRISEEIDICISVAAARGSDGRPTFTRHQFDGCLQSMVDMVDSQLRSSELAGEPSGPYGTEQLRRELELMPWQRINYLLGYLHELAPATCPLPDQPLPNPLEWAVFASLVTWFADVEPVFLQTPGNEALVNRMEQQGRRLMRAMSRQVDCISGSGAGINDPVSESLAEYRAALDELVRGIRNAEITFREARLRPGADVMLGGSVTQRTAYRTPDLTIAPCSAERSCEMTQALDATRALVGLFPDEYLLADQTGLGRIEICYDDMQWVERRSEPVRPEDPNVANYFGRLSFNLLGRYHEGGRTEDVFGSHFVSPDEYHYLIAAADDEVLADGCPTEWVGTRIVTSRGRKSGFNLVPDRLTYLAAARSRPSEVILANWERGAEWRDWFVTGIGVQRLEIAPGDGIRDRLAAHMRGLYQAEQQTLYSALLRPSGRLGPDSGPSLHDRLIEVTTYKTLLRSLLVLLYPETVLDSDAIRAMMEGQSGLLDEAVIRRFRAANVPVGNIHDAGLARLQRFQALWDGQPEAVMRSGSVSISVAHAMARLHLLSRKHFSLPASQGVPGQPGVTGPPADSAEPAGSTESASP